MAKFEYDAENHIYTLDGCRIRSNTEILAKGGAVDYSFLSERDRWASQELGKMVHQATWLLDKGIDWQRKFGTVAGYVEGYKKFKSEYKFKPKFREYPCYDPMIRVATCLDAFGPSKCGEIIVQLKTGKVDDWVALQTAFEEWCLRLDIFTAGTRPPLVSTPNRFGIELLPDGDYTPRRFTDPTDIRTFMAAFTWESWKEKHC